MSSPVIVLHIIPLFYFTAFIFARGWLSERIFSSRRGKLNGEGLRVKKSSSKGIWYALAGGAAGVVNGFFGGGGGMI